MDWRLNQRQDLWRTPAGNAIGHGTATNQRHRYRVDAQHQFRRQRLYRAEQYAHLTDGNTRVRLNVKRLSDGSVSAYGFYTGTQSQWQRVPVIAAQARGDQRVADMGRGIEVIWTPAADPASVMSIPALEGVTLNPTAWVFPPTEQANKILVNPVHPPDYQDAIVWFPEHPHRAPFYLSINTRMLKREDDPSA